MRFFGGHAWDQPPRGLMADCGLNGHRKGRRCVWLAATNGFSLGSGLGTHCNRKRRLNAAVLRARLLLSPHSSHLDSAPGVSGSLWFSFTRCRAMYAARSRAVLRGLLT